MAAKRELPQELLDMSVQARSKFLRLHVLREDIRKEIPNIFLSDLELEQALRRFKSNQYMKKVFKKKTRVWENSKGDKVKVTDPLSPDQVLRCIRFGQENYFSKAQLIVFFAAYQEYQDNLSFRKQKGSQKGLVDRLQSQGFSPVSKKPSKANTFNNRNDIDLDIDL